MLVPPSSCLDSKGNVLGTCTQGELLPIGGERLFESSLEARYKLTRDFALATFFDTGFNTLGNASGAPPGGDLTASNAPEYFQRNLQYAVGMGLRYHTLVGPIRADFAYRLPFGAPSSFSVDPSIQNLPLPSSGGCFGIGAKPGSPTANPEPACALHVSIGEAF
jgi:translocation and assembly module TamA